MSGPRIDNPRDDPEDRHPHRDQCQVSKDGEAERERPDEPGDGEDQGHDSRPAWRAGADPASDSERRDRHPPQCDDRRCDADHRDCGDDQRGLGERRRDGTGEPREAAELEERDDRPKQEEQGDPEHRPGDRHEECVDGGERRDLGRSRAAQAKRDEPALPPGGRESGGAGDEHRDRPHGPDHRDDHDEADDPVDRRRFAIDIECGDRARTGGLQCLGGLPLDDEQLVRRAQSRLADGPHDRPEPVAEFVGGSLGDQLGKRR